MCHYDVRQVRPRVFAVKCRETGWVLNEFPDPIQAEHDCARRRRDDFETEQRQGSVTT